MKERSIDRPWVKIFKDYQIDKHNFDENPFKLTAKMIKNAVQDFTSTGKKEVRILCYQTERKSRPQIFKDMGLFLLPIKNGEYMIIKGEGYIDIPDITSEPEIYNSKLDFDLHTSKIGDSEMQHLDFAYASSLIRTFMEDDSLVLTIRGRKYTPDIELDFFVGKHKITTKSVQTEVDAGYEGKNQVVLVEAKNSKIHDVIIRQLYYPFRQWQEHTDKKVKTLFFEKKDDIFNIWQFVFDDPNNYNSIRLEKCKCYKIE